VKFKKSWYLVGAFVIALLFFFSHEAEAHGTDSQHFGTGIGFGAVHYSGGVTQEISYLRDNRWRFAYERLGGKSFDTVNAIRISREVSWRADGTGPSFSIGAQYFDRHLEDPSNGKAIVSDNLTFSLGVGYAWALSSDTRVRLGALHSSTGGRSDRNGGIDRLVLNFDWRY
jgi:hypothetical protein